MAENTGNRNKNKNNSRDKDKRAAAQAQQAQARAEAAQAEQASAEAAEAETEAAETAEAEAVEADAKEPVAENCEGGQEPPKELSPEEIAAQEHFADFMKNVAKLADEKAEAEQKLARLQADFDNFRRRKAKESEDQIKTATAGLMTALLPVLDNFERAMTAMAQSPDKDGVLLIQKQLQNVLEQAGLSEIEAAGADFDPNFHEAVMQTDAGEENRGKVTLVVQKGYLLNDKLLRASMVQVGC